MDEQEVEVTGEPKARDSFEEQLAARRAEEIKDELAPMPSETPEEPVAEAAPEPVAEAAPEPVAEVAPEPEMVTVKVDGNEFQLPKDKVDAEGGVEVVQMKIAAAKRLEEARQIREQALKEAAPKATPAPAPQQEDEAALIEALRFGDEKAAVQAARKLSGQNQPDPQTIAAIVQAEISKTNAVESFKRDFPEIVKDPYMARLALDMEQEARRNGDRRPHHELYQAIGKGLTEWRGKVAGSFKEKQEKKASVTPIPQAKAKAVLPEEPRPPTRAEILEQERKARKQA